MSETATVTCSCGASLKVTAYTVREQVKEFYDRHDEHLKVIPLELSSEPLSVFVVTSFTYKQENSVELDQSREVVNGVFATASAAMQFCAEAEPSIDDGEITEWMIQ